MLIKSGVFLLLVLTSSLAGPVIPDAGLPAGTELVGKRTEYTKTFVGPDGNYVTTAFPVPVHELNAQGEWVELDEFNYCWPQVALNWTGTIVHQQSSYNKVSGDMSYRGAGPASHPDWQPWVKYDLSPVGDGSTIDSAYMAYYCYNSSPSPAPTTITLVVDDPCTLDAQVLYNEITTGFPLTGTYASGLGWHFRFFDPIGCWAIQDRLDDDWIAFGIHATTDDTLYSGVAYGYGGGPGGAYVPYLAVEWTPPPPVDVACQEIIVPDGTVRIDSLLVPIARWRNMVDIDTTTFEAFCYLINPSLTRVYGDTITITGLLPQTDTVVSFAAFNVGTAEGLWTVRCSTHAVGDYQANNDLLWDHFWVTASGANPDVAMTEIIAPVGYYDTSALVTPQGRWENNSSVTVGFTAIFTVTDPNDVPYWTFSQPVNNLAPGRDTVVTFPGFTLDTTSGVWTTRCSTYTIGDTITVNDVLGGGFGVYPNGFPPVGPDVEAVAVHAPAGYYDTCATVTPQATWGNNGVDPAYFTAYFSIYDPNDVVRYTDAITILGLPAGLDTLLTFGDFTLDTLIGTWTSKCSTAAPGDTFPGNDIVTRTFGVFPGGGFPWPSGWTEVAPMPGPPSNKVVKRGGWLVYHPENTFIYAAKGYKTNDFYFYEAFGDSWKQLNGMPYQSHPTWYKKAPRKGSKGVTDNMDCIYATQGNNSLGFWRYVISGDSWERMPDVPLGSQRKKVKGGTDMVYIVQGDTGYVYLLKGYKTEFYRFNTQTGEWEDLAPAPVGARPKWDKGSWLCVEDEHADVIWAHKAKYHELYTYDIGADTWSEMKAGMPYFGRLGRRKKSKDGGSAAWYDGSIYALKGGNTQSFWEYDVAKDSWYELDSIPAYGSTGRKKRVKYGADLVNYGGGPAFFALKGNKTLEFWRYVFDLTPPSMAASRPARSGASSLPGLEPVGMKLATMATGAVRIDYALPSPGPATLTVFDIAGRARIRRELLLDRRGQAALDLKSLGAGTYLLRLESDAGHAIRKVVLLH